MPPGTTTAPLTVSQPDRATADNQPYAVLLSNRYFQRGRIKADVFLEDEVSRCQFILNRSLGTEVFIGYNPVIAAYEIVTWKPSGSNRKPAEWSALAITKIGSPPAKTWLSTEIVVSGSNVSMFVQGARVVSAQTQILRSQLGMFFQGGAPVVVRNLSIDEERPKAFVVMQFTEAFNALYNEVIKPVCEDFGYEAVRADDIYTSGLIIKEITQNIQDASVIIADITPNNPNVYHEVGYSHGINKPTILLSDRNQEKLPFDVSGFRTLFYENSIGGKRKVEESLKKHLTSVSGSG
jgi:hypothetical protein